MNDKVTNPENVTASDKRDDAITANANPRPWRIAEGWHEAIVDEGNNVVASGSNAANAALIVDAVNYYKPDLHCDWRELTPEEAVAHCREVAARLGDTPCARDHLQLAAWIEERGRLRDIVRVLANDVTNLLANYEYRYSADPSSRRFVELTREFVEKARAAIGEGGHHV